MTMAAVFASLPSCSAKVTRYRTWAAENEILENSIKELSKLPPSTIQTILNRMKLKSYKAKDIVVPSGRNMEAKLFIICSGHVIEKKNKVYHTNLGPGKVIGADLFTLAHGATSNYHESYEALTDLDILELSLMQRDQLLASGIIDTLASKSKSTTTVETSSKVVPVDSTVQYKNLREVRKAYGANSSEYEKELDRIKSK